LAPIFHIQRLTLNREHFVTKFWISLLSILFSWGALAQQLTMEQMSASGSGCPAGSVGATLSPDGTALSVLYSQFTVEGTGSAEKTCQVVVRMRAPQGYRVRMASADLRGFNALPEGARSQFDTTIRFTDWRDWTQAESYSQKFAGPMADDFFQQMETPRSKWGNCGGMQFSIVLDTKFKMNNPTADSGALSSLDSSDITAGAANVYHLALESCKGGGGNGNGNGNGHGNGNGRGNSNRFN
jgi:hypothetical protein